MSFTLFLDIETVPAQDPRVREEIAARISPPASMKKAETIAEWEKNDKPKAIDEKWLKTSFDGAFGHAVVIGYAFDDAEPSTLYSDEWLINERAVLERFFGEISRGYENQKNGRVLPLVVGHRVWDFDLRFLWQRAVVHALRWPAVLPNLWDHRARDRVFDTMTAWAGPREFVSLDKLCLALGVEGKGVELGGEEIDGSKVWEFVKAGRLAEVATYCDGDVKRVREIYRRMRPDLDLPERPF